MEKQGLRDGDVGNYCSRGGLGLLLAASDGAFIVVKLCKSGERRRASAHNIQLLQDIHKHLHKQ